MEAAPGAGTGEDEELPGPLQALPDLQPQRSLNPALWGFYGSFITEA